MPAYRVQDRDSFGPYMFTKITRADDPVVEIFRFEYLTQARAYVTITADHDKGQLSFRLVNTAGFELLTTPWPAAKVTGSVIEELAKRICGQPNQFV